MGTPSWIQYTEQVVGENHPSLSDVINRPMKTIYNMLVELQDGWTTEDATVTYDSTTTFKVAGDLTDRYVKNRAIEATVTAGVQYTLVESSSYTSPNTTVTVKDAVLDSGLSKIRYGIHPKSTAGTHGTYA